MKLRTTAVAILTMGLAMSAPTAALGASDRSDRMELHCDEGTLEGTTLERSDGASWWDVEDGTVYTTQSLLITDGEGNTVFEHDYGQKSHEAETCTGEHFGFTWDVSVVRAGDH